MRLHAVILAGGRGERFWPLSRRSRPKQFLPLLDDRPMLAHTLERVRGLVDPGDVWIITAQDLERDAIILFGIPPTRPETGYGYIESGEPIEPGSPFHAVKAFREKPDHQTAARYLSDGHHL